MFCRATSHAAVLAARLWFGNGNQNNPPQAVMRWLYFCRFAPISTSMSDKLTTLIDMLLDRARKAGADAADGIVAGGFSQSASVRLGQVEAIERSEDHEIGLRVFVGKRNASISSTRLDEDSITILAERAFAMAHLAPEDPFAGLAEKDQLATSWPEIDMCDESDISSTAQGRST